MHQRVYSGEYGLGLRLDDDALAAGLEALIHEAQEIADRTPKSFRGEDDALYVEALKASLPMFSPDGVMAADGAAQVRTLLAGSMDTVRGASIDVSRTYTNEFVHGR